MTPKSEVEQAIANIAIHQQCSNIPSPNDMEVLYRHARASAQLQSELNALQSKLEKVVGATGLNNLSEFCDKIEHWQRIEKEVMTMPRPCTDNDKHRLTSSESEQSQVGAHLQSKPLGMKSAEDWRDKYFGISVKCNFWKSHYNFSAVEFEVVIQAIQQDAIQAERASNQAEIERLVKLYEDCRQQVVDLKFEHNNCIRQSDWEEQRAAIRELCEALRTIQIAREHSKVCDCFNCSLISKHSQGDK